MKESPEPKEMSVNCFFSAVKHKEFLIYADKEKKNLFVWKTPLLCQWCAQKTLGGSDVAWLWSQYLLLFSSPIRINRPGASSPEGAEQWRNTRHIETSQVLNRPSYHHFSFYESRSLQHKQTQIRYEQLQAWESNSLSARSAAFSWLRSSAACTSRDNIWCWPGFMFLTCISYLTQTSWKLQ